MKKITNLLKNSNYMNKIHFITIFIIISILFSSCSKKTTYIKNEGYIFGTTYHFTYKNKKDLEPLIKEQLKTFNNSLNNYNPNSIISRINSNDTSVIVDDFFIECFNRAHKISTITNGAFDITVAPIVNAWGFGFNESTTADSSKIDSLMQYVGFHKIKLNGNKIIKNTDGIMLDASAIAKGFGVDIVAELFESKGIENYMVEIGGEVRAKGLNPTGKLWRIGIDKPIDDAAAIQRELQAIVSLNNKSLATSGNYRQFYKKNGIKYSHTINPKTGYPARNSLLSASVLANNCITADAFATAFMVMGIDNSIKLSQKLNYIEVYFIYADTNSSDFRIYSSKGFQGLIND